MSVTLSLKKAIFHLRDFLLNILNSSTDTFLFHFFSTDVAFAEVNFFLSDLATGFPFIVMGTWG